MAGTENREWRKAGGCEDNACVEVATVGDRIAVRDGKDPDGPRLIFTAGEWTAFLSWLPSAAA